MSHDHRAGSHRDPMPHNFTEANRAHYNKTAATYDAMDFAATVATQAGEKVLAAYPFDADATYLMDYACGTGLVSRTLAPYAKVIVGVDISQGMVDQYNERVYNQGIPAEEMRAVCYGLKGQPGELDGLKFDVIVCSQSYHHFSSIQDVTTMLVTFLKPQGMLMIIDLIKSEHTTRMHTGHDAADHVKHTVAHKGGFQENDIRPVLEAAGLEKVAFTTAVDVEKNGKKFQLFLATGVRPLH